MALPVTLHHHDTEAAIDLVARLAVANGFPSLREFLTHTDISARDIVEGDTDALSVVSDWSAVPVSRLARLAGERRTVGGTWRMGCGTFSKEMRPGRTMRFCAKCVLDDREREPGRMVARAYRRAWWNSRGIEACPEHDCAITEVAVDTNIDLHDFPSFVNINLSAIEAAAGAARPGAQPSLDRFLIDQVMMERREGFLEALDAHVVDEFSRYLGELLKLHDVKECMDDETNLREWGFRIAIKGKEEIRRVLAAIIDQKRPKAGCVEPCLGPMTLWLRRNIDRPKYQSLIDLMQDIVERNMPFAEGQVILRPVRQRYIYCVNSAHAEFGITKDRIRALMSAHDAGFRQGLPDSCTYFNAETLRSILRDAKETLTRAEAGAALGLKEARMYGLLDAGVLEQVETRDADERAYTRIRKVDLDAFVVRLSDRMIPVLDDEGLWTLSAAAKSLRRPFPKLVAMILDGDLKAFIVPGDEPLFHRVRAKSGGLNADAWRMATGNDLLRAKEVEIALGTTTSTVNDLIARGHLRQRSLRSETGRTVKFIERQSVADFLATHVSLSAIAKSRQGFRATIRADLDALGITPIFEPIGFNARFYRKDDLARYW